MIMGEEGEDDYGSCGYHVNKRIRLSHNDLLTHILKEISDLKTCVDARLTNIETKVSVLSQTSFKMSSKLDSMEKTVNTVASKLNGVSSNPPILVSSDNSSIETANAKSKVIALNKEEDYPTGSWIGDPTNPVMRVRCPISPQALLHIESTCISPEKMAVTLLDYLFTKDELATSNLSGKGRWNKKQLNPLMIYGIRCHLQYKFGINVRSWHKICQNMDAKCRALWKRRFQGTETSSTKAKTAYTSTRKEPVLSEDLSFDYDTLQSSNLDLNCIKVIARVLNDSSDHMSNLQNGQEIILSEGSVLTDSQGEKSILIDRTSGVHMASVIHGDDIASLEISDNSPNLASHVAEEDDESAEEIRPSLHSFSIKDEITEEDPLTLQVVQETILGDSENED